jgi:riboflavin biosynthesis pyrimidine reductase
VSGFSPTDRLVMGLLRALADVVLVGAATLRASSGKARTAAEASPPAAAAISDLRRRLGLPRRPTLLVATRGGDLDPTLPAFRDAESPVVIAAPGDAAARLRSNAFGPHVRVEALPHDDAGSPHGLLAIATRLGARVVLSEAGPHLTAQLVGAGLLDELFLTLAPQLAGRDADAPRLNLLEGVALWPSAPAWISLASVRRSGDHLFLRYRIAEDGA